MKKMENSVWMATYAAYFAASCVDHANHRAGLIKDDVLDDIARDAGNVADAAVKRVELAGCMEKCTK